jgi:diguanylate cyclase (GGDEF)-like protein
MKGRILIVEDELIVALDLKQVLEQNGFEVAGIAENAYLAIQSAIETRPDLALMDINLKGRMDGIETARIFRESYGVPVVFLTAYCDDEILASAAKEMPYGYLTKPFSERELKAAVQIGLHKRSEDAKLRMRATKDPLTGLFNRATVLDLLQGELDRASRSRSQTGFLLVDVDHFKRINDTYGHSAGDEVLVEVAARLKKAVRSYDFVGRYGGDEFCAVLPNCPERDLRERIEAIRLALGVEPVLLGETRLTITTSIGSAVATANSSSAAETVATADVALYRAKDSGRNCSVCCLRRLSVEATSGQNIKTTCATCDPIYSTKCLVAPHLARVDPSLHNVWCVLPASGTSDSSGRPKSAHLEQH